ncbi:MAG TPA: lysylphosphatidylglycerol synthase domain-containing protein [Gemmatimonadaceae bacterium]|nr:lysylphosphatidylglycerol synthase domain-containing protein [Gemmatimonadaceae bacterium]
MTRVRRRSPLLSFAIWVALTTALLVALRTLPWQSAVQEMARVRSGWIGAAILANAAILVVWATEWRLLAPAAARVLWASMFEVVSTMAAVLNSIPFFAGEATGVALLVDRVALARGAAVSMLALDQLLSGLSKLAVLGLAAAFVPLPSWLRAGVLTLIAAVSVLLVVLFVIAHRWDRARALLLARPSAPRRALARVVSAGAHLEALRETRRARWLVLLAVSKKGMELAAVLAVQAAFGLSPSLSSGLLVVASVSVATLAPIAPANVGVYEAAVFAAYRYTGVAPDAALALAVTQHLCFLLPMLATGYVTASLRQLAMTRRS